MDNTPREPGTVKSILTATLIVGGVGLVWLLVVTTGAVEIPACADGSCGFVVAALGVGALVFLVVAAVATVTVVKVGRVVGDAVELRRYGRWLSLSERSGPASMTDAEVQVQYHDATGGALGGVEIAYIVGGRDPVEPVSWRSTTVTDFSGIAVIPVHVRAAPAIVTVRASVPSNPAVKRTAGVFLIGVGSGRP